MSKIASCIIVAILTVWTVKAQIRCGSERTEMYFNSLKNCNIALVVNHTARVGQVHLLDTLLAAGIKVKTIFAPEHGFRGVADAGEHVHSNVDQKTGIRVISLYGKNFKPKAADLAGIDIVVFDIQDVGVRFYTYLSTMHYVMEACAEHNIPFIVLDRPNPNGAYTDGPMLESRYRSFVGIDPIPLVHGMTLGELAQMINGEGWLRNGLKCKLIVIPCENYTHQMSYNLPVKPSPNLPDSVSVRLYPSLGLFEGTVISVGRGTDIPFHTFGHPQLTAGNFSFKPKSMSGATNPPYSGEVCRGLDLSSDTSRFTLRFLIYAYQHYPQKERFFNNFFENLCGTGTLRKQIEQGLSENEIRKTWQNDLQNFIKKRKKYMLYH